MKEWISALAILTCCLPTPAVAGPLGVNTYGTVKLKYNDNVFLDDHHVVADYIAQVSPRLEGKWRTERTDVRINGRSDFYFYRDVDELNATDFSCDGFMGYQWSSRLRTTVAASFLDDERRDRELDESGLLFNDDTRRRYRLSLGGDYVLAELTQMSVSYTYQQDRYDDPRTMDYTSHAAQMVLSHNLSPYIARTTGRLQLNASLYDYDRNFVTRRPFLYDTVVTEVDDRRDITYGSVTVGLSHAWTETVEIGCDMGARYSYSDAATTQRASSAILGRRVTVDQNDSGAWGVLGQMQAAYTGLYTHASFLASHDYVPASGRDGATKRTTLQLDAGKRFSGELSANAQARGFLNRSDENDAGSETDELTLRFSMGVRYALNRHWQMGLQYVMTRIDNRENNTDYTQNLVALTFNWNWQLWE